MKFLSSIMGNSISLEEELINLRLTSKQMQRASKKCEKNEKAAVDKLKKVSSFWYHLYLASINFHLFIVWFGFFCFGSQRFLCILFP